MENFSFSFLKIDLRIINTVENCKRLLEDNQVDTTRVSYEKVFELKTTADFLFFDRETFCIVAFIRKREHEIEFVSEIFQQMHRLDSIKYVKKEHKLQTDSIKLDDILEKISSSGMNSLSRSEKEFLDNQSKK